MNEKNEPPENSQSPRNAETPSTMSFIAQVLVFPILAYQLLQPYLSAYLSTAWVGSTLVLLSVAGLCFERLVTQAIYVGATQCTNPAFMHLWNRMNKDSVLGRLHKDWILSTTILVAWLVFAHSSPLVFMYAFIVLVTIYRYRKYYDTEYPDDDFPVEFK